MQTIYFGRTLINDVFLGSVRMDDIFERPELRPGQPYQGGIIIFVSGSFPNQNGIIASYQSSSAGTTQWGCSGTSISTSRTIGSGQSNTNNILAGCATRPILASVADGLVRDGYSDWYMPSRDEVGLIISASTFIPGFPASPQIVASSQANSTQADFYSSPSWTVRNKDGVTDPQSTWPIRSF